MSESELEIETRSVQVNNGDLGIDAYLALPKGDTACNGVIVIQEIFGVNDHIRDVTRRFAMAGYGAIAPAIYQRQAPGFEAGYTDADLEEGRKYKNQTQVSELLSDLEATIEYLYGLSPIKQDGVGCIGFCFGGHVAYLAATLDPVKATACFYGAGIANWCPGNGKPTIERTGEISGTLYGFFGEEDPLIPNEQVDKIEAELEKQNVSHRIFRYEGASHGFFCDQRESYNQKAAEDAWAKTLSLFEKNLS